MANNKELNDEELENVNGGITWDEFQVLECGVRIHVIEGSYRGGVRNN